MNIFSYARSLADAVVKWLDRLDPGVHRRVKGLRLVTAFGIAVLGGAVYASIHYPSSSSKLTVMAGGFALWASVSEARTVRSESARDLLVLVASALAGAIFTVFSSPFFGVPQIEMPELVLVVGAFLVGYLKRFGIFGGGIGSQFCIGQLLAFGLGLSGSAVPLILAAGFIAAIASIVPRMLSGPAEHPATLLQAPPAGTRYVSSEMAMGLQGASAVIVFVLLNNLFGLEESIWGVTACIYVVSGSAISTADRVWKRLIGTAVGVPIALACLPLAMHAPGLIWALAAFAMIVYAMALPERYDIACGAYAFALIVTLAASGEHSLSLLGARLWETALGGALGLASAFLIFPLRPLTEGRRI